MNFNFSNFEVLRAKLENKKTKIVIISHVNPDGDALGSVLGLYHFLAKTNYQYINVILPSGFPSFLAWMPGSEDILIADSEENQRNATQLIDAADIVFCLDFNDLTRAASLERAISKAKGLKVLIDHHPDAKDQFDAVFSEIEVSSTSELIYCFFEMHNLNVPIDLKIAECLYTGIVTDTGSFSYSCNFPSTYRIIARFMEIGLDGERIHRLIYDTYSENRMRLLGHCLGDRLRVMHEHKTAYIHLSKNDLKHFNFEEGDTEGVVNYALSIKGIRIAAIFIERDDKIKISFRSEGDLNVNYLARKYYTGGGHKNASGGQSYSSMDETLTQFEKLIADISSDNFSVLKDIQDIH